MPVPHYGGEVEVAGAVPVPHLPDNQGPGSDEGFLLALWQIESPDYCRNRDFSLKYCALKAKSMSKPNKDKNSC